MPQRDERTQLNDPRRIEFRAVMPGDPATPLERRADDDAVPGFEGYASTWWVVDSYGTAFAPGAFTKTLNERKARIPHLWQHLPEHAIGYHREIAEDDVGLKVDVAIIDDGAEGSVAIKRLRGGVPLALSHGFRTMRERPATDADPLILATDMPEWITRNLPDSVYVIEEVKAYETSTVTFPANEAAAIGAVRHDASLHALALALDDLRTGRVLDPARRDLISDLAAAWSDAPHGSDPEARAETKARRIDIESTLARYGLYVPRMAT